MLDHAPDTGSAVPGGYAEVLRIAWPLIVSTGSFTLMQFCDRMFLAWYSGVAIQAALPAGILSFTLICGFMALAGYAATFVAQYFGAGDREGCSRATVQGVILALLSWPLLLLLILPGRWLLRFSGHDQPVLVAELSYFTILMLGGVAVPLGAAVSSFFTGRGDTRTNMIATITGNAANIALDYAMIFGRWGFPEWGIAGAAWATVISGFIPPVCLGLLYFSRRLDAEYRTRQLLRFDRDLFRRMIRFGLPSAAHLVLDVGAFAFFVLLTGRLGATALSASNIALSINNVAFMPLLWLSIAASILVGQYQGRRDSTTAARSGWTALKLGCWYMLLVAATFILFPAHYFALFTGRGAAAMPMDAVVSVGRWLLLMMAAWGLLDAVNLILSGALKGAGDTRFVMYYSVAMAWGLWIPGEVLIVFVFHGGVLAAWIWMMIFIIITASGFFWRFRAGRWKMIDLLEREPPFRPAAGGAEAMAVVE